MIYTLTVSPCIDYFMEVEDIKTNTINRSIKENIVAGGKGINVSVMLNNLGTKSIAMGFTGGFSGDYIKNFLNERNIKTNFVSIEANSRINVKLCGYQSETSINANGPDIPENKIDELIEKMSLFKKDDYFVISGNVPRNLRPDIYEYFLSKINTSEINIVIDCEKLWLKSTLKYKPFLIKPNKEELEDFFGQKIVSNDDLIEKCKILQSHGAKNVIVSLGKDGAFMLTETGKTYYVNAPDIILRSSIGSGDSLVAGFLHQYNISHNYESALKYGVACGSASAECKYLANKNDVDNIFKCLK